MKLYDLALAAISAGVCLTLATGDQKPEPVLGAAWSTISETMSVTTMTGTTHIDPELVENELEYGRCGIRWKRKELIFRDGFEGD